MPETSTTDTLDAALRKAVEQCEDELVRVWLANLLTGDQQEDD